MKIGNFLFFIGAWDGVSHTDDYNNKIVSFIGYAITKSGTTFFLFGFRITRLAIKVNDEESKTKS